MKRARFLLPAAVCVSLGACCAAWAAPVKPLAVLDFSTGESVNMRVAGPAPAITNIAGGQYAVLAPQRAAQPMRWDPKMPNPAFPAVDRSGDKAAGPAAPRLVLDIDAAKAGLVSPTNLAFVFTVYDMTERNGDSAGVSLLGVNADKKPFTLGTFILSGDPYQGEPLFGAREVRKVVKAADAFLNDSLDNGDVALETRSHLLVRRIEVYLLPPSPLDKEAARSTGLQCTYPACVSANGVLDVWRRDYCDRMVDQASAYADWIDAETAAREAARHSLTAPAGANNSAPAGLAKAAADLNLLALDVFRAMDSLFYDGKVALIRQDAEAYHALLAGVAGANERLRAAAGKVKDDAADVERKLRAALAAAGYPVGPLKTDPEPEGDYLDQICFALFVNSTWDCMDPFDAAGRTARFFGISAKSFLMGGGTLEPDRQLKQDEVASQHKLVLSDRARGWDVMWGVGHHTSHTMRGFPPWFLEKNPEPYDKDHKGANAGAAWDLFNPEVQAYFQDMLTGMAKVYAGNPNMPPYFYWGEPIGGQGYSAAARKGFAAYLKARHGDIKALNAAWGSSYASFDEIAPPPPPGDELRTRATGLTYEFEKFRRDNLTDWTRAGAAALKRGNPAARFWFEGWGRYDYLMSYGMDQYGLFKAADLSAVHTGSLGQDSQRVLGMALSRYTGTPLADGEINIYGPYYNGAASLAMLRAAAESHVLMQCWYDTRLFLFWYSQFFSFRVSSYGGARLYDGEITCPMCPSAFSVRTVRQKANLYNRIIRATKPVNPKVGILLSSTSFINSWPYNELEHETYPMHGWLFNSDFGYTIIPEDAIMDGKEDLQAFNVVLAPWAAWLQPKAAAVLLDFVRLGGVLISSGPVGAFDQYGKPLNTILEAVLGKVEVAYAANERSGETRLSEESVARLRSLGDEYTTHFGGWAWTIAQKAARPESRVLLKHADGAPVAFEAPYGYGKVIVATGPLGKNGLRRFVMNEIERRVAPLVRKSCDDGFHVMSRVDAAGNLYLGVFNQNTGQSITDTLLVDGRYDSVADLGLSGAWPVAVSRQGSRTAVPLTLAPGEGTVLAMGSMLNARIAPRDRQAPLVPDPPLVTVSDEELAGAGKKVTGSGLAAPAKAEALALLATARKQRSFGYNERAQRLMRLALATGKATECFSFPEDAVIARRAGAPVKVDGVADEWRAVPRGSVKGATAAGGEFAFQWDKDNLYLLAVVRDQDLREVEEKGSDANWIWLFDGVRLAINPANTAPLAVGGPLYDMKYHAGRTFLAVSITGRKYATSACGFSAAVVKSAVQKVEGGYVMELAIPMKDAMLPPVAGADVGLLFQIVDHGSGLGFTRFCDREDIMSDSLHFGRLRFTE